jgi:predicted GNAT family N-acyltransferase
MGNINIKQLDKKYQTIYENKGINYKTVPTAKIGRLAIDKKYQKSGLGTFMIKWSQYCIMKFSKRIGVRFITIDAYMNVIEFYSKNKFEITYKTKQNIDKISGKYKKTLKADKIRAQQITIPMFFDLKE